MKSKIFKKICSAINEFKEGYEKQKEIVENINSEKGFWIYNNQNKLRNIQS